MSGDKEARETALAAAEAAYAKVRAEQIASGQDPATRKARDIAFEAGNEAYVRAYTAATLAEVSA